MIFVELLLIVEEGKSPLKSSVSVFVLCILFSVLCLINFFIFGKVLCLILVVRILKLDILNSMLVFMDDIST